MRKLGNVLSSETCSSHASFPLVFQNFGCFVQLTKQGVVRHRGLVHISTLVSDRMEQDLVKEYIESKVGPIGSKVWAF